MSGRNIYSFSIWHFTNVVFIDFAWLVMGVGVTTFHMYSF